MCFLERKQEVELEGPLEGAQSRACFPSMSQGREAQTLQLGGTQVPCSSLKAARWPLEDGADGIIPLTWFS